MSEDYLRMLADSARIKMFDKAISAAVKPDDVVADLGCGVGTFAMQAKRAGARRVFGIEMNSIIETAREIAAHNGLEVEFFNGDARDVKLPEPASLFIFEDYGTGLLDGPGAKLLEIGRENWVADDYRVLPQGATLNVAPICSEITRQRMFPLGTSDNSAYGFNFQPLLHMAHNSVIQIRGAQDLEMAAPPATVLTHDFKRPLPTRWQTEAKFDFAQDQTIDGFCLWHDLHLSDTITYSNHPQERAIWGQYFFSTPAAWQASAGDQLTIRLGFHDAMGDGFWKWQLMLRDSGGSVVQSSGGNSFAASTLTSQQLSSYQTEEVVQLTDRARREAAILSLVDGQRSVNQICDLIESSQDQYFPKARSRTQILEMIQQTLELRRAA